MNTALSCDLVDVFPHFDRLAHDGSRVLVRAKKSVFVLAVAFQASQFCSP